MRSELTRQKSQNSTSTGRPRCLSMRSGATLTQVSSRGNGGAGMACSGARIAADASSGSTRMHAIRWQRAAANFCRPRCSSSRSAGGRAVAAPFIFEEEIPTCASCSRARSSRPPRSASPAVPSPRTATSIFTATVKPAKAGTTKKPKNTSSTSTSTVTCRARRSRSSSSRCRRASSSRARASRTARVDDARPSRAPTAARRLQGRPARHRDGGARPRRPAAR